MTNFSNNMPLPSEADVIIELESFLSEVGRPITPRETYIELARRFELTYEQQNRLMQNGKDVHWENRVRQARRKLLNYGKLDPNQPRGRWAVRPSF